MRVPKRNPRQEYRLKQRELIEASPLMAKKYPRLKGLRVILEYFDAAGTTRNGGNEVQAECGARKISTVVCLSRGGVRVWGF